jgi:CheY-like chemotaxis protein
MWDSIVSMNDGWSGGAAVAERSPRTRSGGYGFAAPAGAFAPQPAHALAAAPAPAKRLVAVADDDPAVIAAVTVWLEHLGYDTRVFDSGDALLGWVQSEPASVAAFVLDVQMDGRDGPTTCREIRGMPQYAQTPAVLMSSIDPAELAGSARAVGSSWVSKDGRMLGNLAACLARMLP